MTTATESLSPTQALENLRALQIAFDKSLETLGARGTILRGQGQSVALAGRFLAFARDLQNEGAQRRRTAIDAAQDLSRSIIRFQSYQAVLGISAKLQKIRDRIAPPSGYNSDLPEKLKAALDALAMLVSVKKLNSLAAWASGTDKEFPRTPDIGPALAKVEQEIEPLWLPLFRIKRSEVLASVREGMAAIVTDLHALAPELIAADSVLDKIKCRFQPRDLHDNAYARFWQSKPSLTDNRDLIGLAANEGAIQEGLVEKLNSLTGGPHWSEKVWAGRIEDLNGQNIILHAAERPELDEGNVLVAPALIAEIAKTVGEGLIWDQAGQRTIREGLAASIERHQTAERQYQSGSEDLRHRRIALVRFFKTGDADVFASAGTDVDPLLPPGGAQELQGVALSLAAAIRSVEDVIRTGSQTIPPMANPFIRMAGRISEIAAIIDAPLPVATDAAGAFPRRATLGGPSDAAGPT